MTSPRPHAPRTLVVVVPDGAAEPGADTSLERAATPNLDRLAARQGVGRLVTVPPGWQPGTEVGLPALLGVTPAAPPGRGWLEAAALGVDVPPGRAAWRLDASDPGRVDVEALRRAVAKAGLDADVHDLPGHRHLLVGPRNWGDAASGHDRSAPAAWRARLAPVETALGVRLHAWGGAHRPSLPARSGLVVRPDSTAALGVARLVGADVLDDLDAALDAIAAGRHACVLVHDARPDEAGHARDAAAMAAAIAAVDREVLGPVLAAADTAGAAVVVAPDHGCDPATGAHDGAPVPATWPGAPGAGRVTEAATARQATVDAAALLRRLTAHREAA